MLFKVAVGLLAVWGVGAAGLVHVGDTIHVVLLVALLFLLLSFARRREAAAQRERGSK
jgi:hypothetical protein